MALTVDVSEAVVVNDDDALCDDVPDADGVHVTLGERDDVPDDDGDDDMLAVLESDGVPVALVVNVCKLELDGEGENDCDDVPEEDDVAVALEVELLEGELLEDDVDVCELELDGEGDTLGVEVSLLVGVTVSELVSDCDAVADTL